jgi:hypothetical protein
MAIEEDIAKELKKRDKNGGAKLPAPAPTMPPPTPDEIEAGLLAWRRTQSENELLKNQLAEVRAQKDEMVGVLKSLASILVTYHNTITE